MNDHYELIDSGNLLVIKVLIDTLDFYEISDSANFLRTELNKRSYPSLVFDLSTVEFIDSSVFGFFIEVRNSIKKNGNEIAIVCQNKDILHIISMLKVDEIIRVYPGLEAALKHLRAL
jgi:anti-sigma B factor antagonist